MTGHACRGSSQRCRSASHQNGCSLVLAPFTLPLFCFLQQTTDRFASPGLQVEDMMVEINADKEEAEVVRVKVEAEEAMANEKVEQDLQRFCFVYAGTCQWAGDRVVTRLESTLSGTGAKRHRCRT